VKGQVCNAGSIHQFTVLDDDCLGHIDFFLKLSGAPALPKDDNYKKFKNRTLLFVTIRV